MKPIIRKVLTHEFRLAADLMNSVYARKKQSDYFLWQYSHTPFPAALYGAFLGKKLIGMIGIQFRSLNNNAQLGLIMDIVVDEKYRSKGIFSLLAYHLIKKHNDLDGFCSFTNTLGMKVCVNKLGWKQVMKIDMKTLNMLKQNKRKSLSRNLRSKNQVGFLYNKEVLKWRFESAPHYTYDTIKSGKSFAKVKLFTDPTTQLVYGDIVYLSHQNMSLRPILEYFKKKYVQKITSWALPHTRLFTKLKEKGFTSKPTERYFCLKINNPKYNDLYSVHTWNVFQADSDVF